MLYDLEWLQVGQSFPPTVELERIRRYDENRRVFRVTHLDDGATEYYRDCCKRIERVVGNFEELISFPVIFAYQRLLSLKTADLVCGEYPSIKSAKDQQTDTIQTMREEISLDSQLYSTVLDVSALGDAVWRMYKDKETGKGRFTVWDPRGWFPIVKNDGTNQIMHHVLCWSTNVGTKDAPRWNLTVQIHSKGSYEQRVYDTGTSGTEILALISSTPGILTGLEDFAVINLRAFHASDTVYGQDDYTQIDSIVSEIMVRIGQISKILDKHADPAMTGPVSMLTTDENTGRTYLKTGSFYAISPGETPPTYLTWEGQLEAAFKELELLLQQLYILSEMGSALLDAAMGTSQAISGTAMRFKMVNPLVKARRITNAMTLPLKRLIKAVSSLGYGKIEINDLSVQWKDGLPNDPREVAELVRLLTGATQIETLENALQTYYDKSAEDAKKIIEGILAEKQKNMSLLNPPGEAESAPDEGGMPSGARKGSDTGLNDFSGIRNKNPADSGR